MADLGSKILQAAARLWDKTESQIRLVWRPDLHRVEVYAWVNDDDPDEGSICREVHIRPPRGLDVVTDVPYRTELLLALLDVLEGALRRKEASGAIVARSLN